MRVIFSYFFLFCDIYGVLPETVQISWEDQGSWLYSWLQLSVKSLVHPRVNCFLIFGFFFFFNMNCWTFLSLKSSIVMPVGPHWLEVLKWLWKWFELEVAILQSTIYILPGQKNRFETSSSPTVTTHYTYCVELLKYKKANAQIHSTVKELDLTPESGKWFRK